MLKLRKDDEVVILAGKDKGKRGKVLKVLSSESRVLVEKVNMIKRHVRPDRMGKPGGIVEKEAPLHISNVAIFNATAGTADRVGYKTLEGERKVRVFKSSGEVISGR
ncbi:50S ribosomal protein L24 [Acidithiobacillus sp. HP-6]|uniref:50S ribosomal protein L24 n=1 Tax=unclassified Acidithiobacillus TaxID=2614800 RepID=UPI00187905AC|nr:MULTISPECIES: 50S ribosomal protein L24 [unclassified Acidithiobacillus]MBE7561967.1 50S ribosomal protein L24 [Acidithiobacillus sp. HP-6]MBE7568639.1 50S ribosomal protein L24 [Acidithiobacillus sp. HP-2]MDD5278555.1 50S ribosomal protein L24 [Acidithiobacillus sp.]